MRKIIFLTLVMIFGVSSVSFGAKYLCVSSKSAIITTREGVTNTKRIGKFLVVTKCLDLLGNIDVKCKHRGDYIYSVKSFGIKGKVWCKDNQPIESPDSKVLSCNKKNPNSGNTKVEFNMNFKPSDYISFQMFNSKFGERMKSSEYFEFWRGGCEEIKF